MLLRKARDFTVEEERKGSLASMMGEGGCQNRMASSASTAGEGASMTIMEPEEVLAEEERGGLAQRGEKPGSQA